MSPAEYALFIEKINYTAKNAHVGVPQKLAFKGSGRGQQFVGVDPAVRAHEAITRLLADVAPWWKTTRGIAIRFEAPPINSNSVFTSVAHIFPLDELRNM
jgi:hypothetical protein